MEQCIQESGLKDCFKEEARNGIKMATILTGTGSKDELLALECSISRIRISMKDSFRMTCEVDTGFITSEE